MPLLTRTLVSLEKINTESMETVWVIISLALVLLVLTLSCPALAMNREAFKDASADANASVNDDDMEVVEPSKKKKPLKKIKKKVTKAAKGVKKSFKNAFKIDAMKPAKRKPAAPTDVYAPRRMVCMQNVSGFQCLYA